MPLHNTTKTPGPPVDIHVGTEPASPNEIMLLSNITEFHFFNEFSTLGLCDFVVQYY